MTITPTRPVRQLTRDEAKVLAHYAAGESATTITINTGFTMDLVGRVLDEHAGNDRGRAHQLVLEYQERAQAVAAARGVSGPPAQPARPAPASPAAAKAPVAVKPTRSTPPVVVPQKTAPAKTAPQSTEAQSTQPEGGEPESSLPKPVDELELELEVLLQAADATGVPRLQRAATRIRELAAELRTDLAGHAREAALRAEQAELEARLAEIKEQLRPRRTQQVVLPVATAGDGEAPVDNKAARAWAAAQGLDCPARGRVPGAVTDAYLQATR